MSRLVFESYMQCSFTVIQCYTMYMLVVEVWHSFGTSSLPPSGTCHLLAASITLLFRKWRGQGRLMWNYELLNCHDVTASLSSSVGWEGLPCLTDSDPFHEFYSYFWSIQPLLELKVLSLFLLTTPPGPGSVFNTCQFCFYEQIK